MRNENPPFTLVEDTKALDDLIAAIRTSSAPIALDTETSSLSVNEAEVRLIQVRIPGLLPYIVDFTKVRPEALLHSLRDKHLLLHNAVYDLSVLKRLV